MARRCGGSQRVAQIGLRPRVDPIDARNTENQITVALSAPCAQAT
jgi:hypothetical protein